METKDILPLTTTQVLKIKVKPLTPKVKEFKVKPPPKPLLPTNKDTQPLISLIVSKSVTILTPELMTILPEDTDNLHLFIIFNYKNLFFCFKVIKL